MRTATLTLLVALLLAVPAQAQTTTTTPTAPAPTPLSTEPVPQNSAFEASGMWIWYVSHSSGGSVDAIARKAAKAGVTTVFVKSSDGAGVWSQFSSTLVAALHARGLKVCAWGYVYGSRPRAEARAARTAIARGADCFVIDAESEYEGKYAQAGTYMRKLRAYAGADYPIGVAPFPYVDYHPAYPYSVFLGPGGAQFDLPQMYWGAIGVSVKTIYSRTYNYNTLYGRPIYPLGQTYGGVTSTDIDRFRRYAQNYGATGVSWWSWQASPAYAWSTLRRPLPALPADHSPTAPATPTLARGARGDFIVWAQEHLLAAGYSVNVSGVFDKRTSKAVRAFQTASALPATAALDPPTWSALLNGYSAAKIRWTRSGKAPAGSHGKAAFVQPPPRSARLPAVRNEIRGAK